MMARLSRTNRMTAEQFRLLLVATPIVPSDWASAMEDNVHLRIANAAPATNKRTTTRELGKFFSRIEAMGVCYLEIWQRRETIFVETDFAFRFPNGDMATIPASLIVRTAFGKILDLRFYLDPSPIP